MSSFSNSKKWRSLSKNIAELTDDPEKIQDILEDMWHVITEEISDQVSDNYARIKGIGEYDPNY